MKKILYIYMLTVLSSNSCSEKPLPRQIILDSVDRTNFFDVTTQTTVGEVVNRVAAEYKIPAEQVVLVGMKGRLSENPHNANIFKFMKPGASLCVMRQIPGQVDLEPVNKPVTFKEMIINLNKVYKK